MIPATLSEQGHFYGKQRAQEKLSSADQNSYYVRPDFDGNGQSDGIFKSDRACRDLVWAIVFYLHLAGFVAVSVIYVPMFLQTAINNSAANSGQRKLFARYLEDQDEYNGNGGGGNDQQFTLQSFPANPNELLIIVCIAGAFSLICSSLSMIVVMHLGELFIKISLIFNILIFCLAGSISLVAGAIGGAICSCLMCVAAIWYTCCVWDRIPFAATTLATSVTAVRANVGLALYAYISLILTFGWAIVWTLGAGSTIFVLAGCSSDGSCQSSINLGVLFLFFISFYWTTQVIMNVVHVTTAGTVGTWWFTPNEANSCCSEAVKSSYIRSLTTSFGSICLGSLIVAIIQSAKEVVHSLRDNGDQMLLCLTECLLGCIESLVEYFNKWAYIYVGLYGFSFIEAGSNVMTLFRNRGWTAIVADTMADTVLTMLAIGVGAGTALFTAAMESLLTDDPATIGIAAAVGLFVGYCMSSTLFSVVSSAVNTVIVCFAEAPSEFQTNYPQLSDRLVESWRKAWPDEFGQYVVSQK